MSSWTGDVDESEDGEPDDNGGFSVKLQKHVDEGTVNELEELDLVKGIDDVDDVELLKQAYFQFDGSGNLEKKQVIENRLNALDAVRPEGETEQADLEEATEADDSEDESEEDSGWGGTPVDEADELEDDEDDEDSSESEEPVMESVEDMTDESPSLGEETEETQSSAVSADGGGPPEPQGAMSVEEAANQDRRWKMLVWGPPGLFKSHFAYTAPEPVAYLDLENKAQDIAQKFEGREIQIWQPEDFHDATDALDSALEWLDWWFENEGERGTIVVDSISLMWEWAKTAYKKEAYPMKDEDEVTLSSNMGSSQDSDWGHIKGMHNDEFRDVIANCDYHFVWTAMETEDYNAVMSGDADGGQTPMKPEGEKNNRFKADTIIRARKDDDGRKVGDLTKSNFTDNLFVGLDRPTFPKLREVIETIEDAEASPSDVDRNSLEDDLGVNIIRADPQQYKNDS